MYLMIHVRSINRYRPIGLQSDRPTDPIRKITVADDSSPAKWLEPDWDWRSAESCKIIGAAQGFRFGANTGREDSFTIRVSRCLTGRRKGDALAAADARFPAASIFCFEKNSATKSCLLMIMRSTETLLNPGCCVTVFFAVCCAPRMVCRGRLVEDCPASEMRI